VNLGIGGAGAVVLEKPKVAALVGLGDFVFKEFAVSAAEAWGKSGPLLPTAGQFFFSDIEMEPAFSDIELDHVPVLNQCEWSSEV
tara:strand:- start:9 stop:263 length:255 start_codon:yes stop_codon:yes gene_type:complete